MVMGETVEGASVLPCVGSGVGVGVVGAGASGKRDYREKNNN